MVARIEDAPASWPTPYPFFMHAIHEGTRRIDEIVGASSETGATNVRGHTHTHTHVARFSHWGCGVAHPSVPVVFAGVILPFMYDIS